MRSFPFFSHSGSALSVAPANLALNLNETVQMTRFLRSLVQTPSASSREGALADLIKQELTTIGIADVYTDRAGNIIARLGNGSGPTLLFDAHMDTVAPTDADWPHGPYAAAIDNGNLYGLGSCDMKGSIAALVYAAKRLIEAGASLHGNLVLAFVVQEEPCEGCALRVIIEQEDIRPDWIVLAEPSNLGIKRGHPGRVLFKVTVRGKSSHSSRPDLGENAITGAARLIFGIDLLAATLPHDPFLGPGTIAVTHIESTAASTTAIPDSCIFFVDRRLTLGETASRAQLQIESIIEREGIQASVEVMDYQANSYTGFPLRTREAFNAWVLEPQHPLIGALSHTIQMVTGQTPAVGNWAFSTDGVYSMGEAGIPTIGFGPGNPDYAHMVDEHIRLDDVARASQIYALLAAVMLSRPSTQQLEI